MAFCCATGGRPLIRTVEGVAKIAKNPEGVTEYSPGCQPRESEKDVRKTYWNPEAGRRGGLRPARGYIKGSEERDDSHMRRTK